MNTQDFQVIENVVVSDQDDRSYRVIELASGMSITIVSDPETDKVKKKKKNNLFTDLFFFLSLKKIQKYHVYCFFF